MLFNLRDLVVIVSLISNRVDFSLQSVHSLRNVLSSRFYRESPIVIFNLPGPARRGGVMTQRDRAFMIRKTDGRGR